MGVGPAGSESLRLFLVLTWLPLYNLSYRPSVPLVFMWFSRVVFCNSVVIWMWSWEEASHNVYLLCCLEWKLENGYNINKEIFHTFPTVPFTLNTYFIPSAHPNLAYSHQGLISHMWLVAVAVTRTVFEHGEGEGHWNPSVSFLSSPLVLKRKSHV